MGLIIYKQERQNLGGVSFLKDISSQIKIKDISDANLFTNQLIKTMILVNTLSGIKEPMSDIVKKDIKEMILMRFKEFSFDEITYAFKLERYGEFEGRVEHFQLFDAKYVSEVLSKYKQWKTAKRKEHNLNQKNDKIKTMDITEDQKERLMLDAVDRCKKEIKETGNLSGITHHIYDFLVDTRRMEKPSKEIRRASYSIALREQKEEVTNEGNFFSSNQLKRSITDLGDGNARTVRLAKTMLLKDYFKIELKDKIISSDMVLQSF